MRRGHEAQGWLLRTSRNKRWLRPHGDEWRLVPFGGCLNTASHVFRLRKAGRSAGHAESGIGLY
eukprot:2572155-Lingulodinium_polyedra.AAC.1